MILHLFFCIIFPLLSTAQECGQRKAAVSFIFGGEYASRGQWPWLAPLFYTSNDEFFCGSSIISKRYLLSASHCFKNKGSSRSLPPDEVYTHLGKYNLNDEDEPGAVRVSIESIKIHPDWNTIAETYDGDIAILKVKDEITFTNIIQPICLPLTSSKVFEVEGTVVGYGFSEGSQNKRETIPKFVMIESVTQEDCLFSHPATRKISSNRMFCAGKTGRNPCKGDSGSGFFVKTRGQYILIGIVSSAIQQECTQNQFVLFTNVAKYAAWIELEAGVKHQDENIILKPLKCVYNIHPGHTEDIGFQCDNQYNFESQTSNVKISHIVGTFSDGKTNTDVKVITFGENKMTYIPDMTATRTAFPNFHKLFIVNCELKHIERSKLAKLTQLTYLNFFGNQLEYFEADVFDDLINLESLFFVYNKIKVLPVNLLSNLKNLFEFGSWANPIEIIPRKFFENNIKLEKIQMQDSNIKKIRFDFLTLPKLKLLNLKNNDCINARVCESCRFSLNSMQDLIDQEC